MIKIDASQGEGGGQILRTALALAAHTGLAVELTGIRARRRNPGLAPQHLAGLLAAARICPADVQGARLQSSKVIFAPRGPVQPGDYVFDVSQLSGQGSAGAVTLLLQAIMLPLALAGGPSRLILRGGTHVAWSPPVHYVMWVLFPTLARLGLRASLQLKRWGWYPEGGGEVIVNLEGADSLHGVDLSARPAVSHLDGLAAASNLPAHIPQRISDRANSLLKAAGLPAGVQPLRVSGGVSTGAGIFLALHCGEVHAGFSALGARGKASEAVATEAVEAIAAFARQTAALDPYLPDQILPYLMLSSGPSELATISITQHTRTVLDIVQRFIDRKVRTEGATGQPGTIHVADRVAR